MTGVPQLCCPRLSLLICLGLALFGFTSCAKKEAVKINLPQKVVAVDDLTLFKKMPIGLPLSGHPWIAHLIAVDLDRDGLMDVVGCEAQANTLFWIRQVSPGKFQEITLATDMQAPVHVEAVDMDGDGDLDLLVSSMGQVFPNNDKIGTIYILENDGHQNFKKHVIETNIMRVTDIRAGDFNEDGKLDLAVCQFGYDQGQIQWMERIGPWEFKSHPLLDLSGGINVVVEDFNKDGHLDIAAQMSQQWEEIYLFEGDGKGNFIKKRIWGSTNEDYASSGMAKGDLNKDGRMDLIFSNGDGFGPSPQPGPRPWHGVQWLENSPDGRWIFHRVGDLGGAYAPVCVDLDGDGFNDVLAVSAFNEWDNPRAQSLVWFRNDGRMNFTPHVLAYSPIQLLTLDAADIFGDGHPCIISGAFHCTPPYDRMSRVLLWQRTTPSK